MKWASNGQRYRRINNNMPGRRPMRKEGMNGIGTGYLENQQLQVADMVLFPIPCKR